MSAITKSERKALDELFISLSIQDSFYDKFINFYKDITLFFKKFQKNI